MGLGWGDSGLSSISYIKHSHCKSRVQGRPNIDKHVLWQSFNIGAKSKYPKLRAFALLVIATRSYFPGRFVLCPSPFLAQGAMCQNLIIAMVPAGRRCSCCAPTTDQCRETLEPPRCIGQQHLLVCIPCCCCSASSPTYSKVFLSACPALPSTLALSEFVLRVAFAVA